jgi:hypothetical protein
MEIKTIDKAEIAAQLRKMTEERLFGDKPWPVDNCDEVHQKFLDWGLIEKVDELASRETTLGRELCVYHWSLFMGHHELSEIAELLGYYGLLPREEAEQLMIEQCERADEKLEDILLPVLRRVYRSRQQ